MLASLEGKNPPEHAKHAHNATLKPELPTTYAVFQTAQSHSAPFDNPEPHGSQPP